MTYTRPLPVAAHIRTKPEGWTLTTCPRCGAECFETPNHTRARRAEPDAAFICAACALGAGPISTARVPADGPYQRRLAT